MRPNIIEDLRQRLQIQRTRFRAIDVSRNSGESDNLAFFISQRALPGQAPSLPAIRINVELQLTTDCRTPFKNSPVLPLKFIAQWARKNFCCCLAQKVTFERLATAPYQGRIHEMVTCTGVFNKVGRVRNLIE